VRFKTSLHGAIMRLRLLLTFAFLSTVTLLSPATCLANRTWHDIHGGNLRGTFKGLNEQKAEIQTSSQLVRIPFWNLTTEDQKFIARRMRDRRQNDKVPAISEAPRDWQIGGRSLTGQLLRVEGQKLWIVIAGRENQFSMDQLSAADAEHARNWTEPIVQKTRHDRWDPFVESESTAEDDSGSSETAAAETDAATISASSVPAESSSWLTHRFFRLGVTVLVCLLAFAWRILRRVLRPGQKLDV
jgi:hypothetical protein